VPQIAAGASGDRIVLQLGSFVLENSAHKVVEQCAAKGLEAHIGHSRDANGRDWFVVRSGEFASADDAKAAIGKFQEVAGVAPRLLHHRGASTVQSVETAAPAPQSAPREPHAVSEAASATVAEATAPTTTADGIAPVAFTPKAAGATPAPETAAAMAEITPAAAPASSHRVHADAGGEHVVVQLGSYQLESSARTVMKECAARGIEVKLGQTHDHDGRAWYIVRTGEFASSEEAAPVLHQIGEINGVTPLVIKHAGGAHHPTVTADSSGS
jgi:cell division protein FtsN